VPKFELYKHNDELFNIYYGIFYELWTFTEFDFEEISIFSNGGHLGYSTALTDTILKGTTQGSFQQSLVEIVSVVSEEKTFF
jgi:hypothetical protein